MRRPKSPLTPAITNAMQAPLQLDLEEAIRGSKARERAYLDTIRPEIDRAARESQTRGTLQSTIEAQKRAAAEKRKRQAELQAQISVALANEKGGQRGRPRSGPADNGPTPERLAKLRVEPGELAIEPPLGAAGDKPHQALNVVEFYRGKWSDEEQQGARYLVQTWNDAEKGLPTVTPNYTGVPGAAFGARDGGLKRGGKTERFVDLHQDVLNIEGIIFAKFGIKGLSLIRWFCWETLSVAQEGASLGERMKKAGQSLAPFVSPKSEDRLWGITFGSLQTIFRFAYAEWVVKEEALKQRASTPEQIAMRREHRARRMGKDWPAARADRDMKREEQG